jgi:hypothetical protein
MHVVAIMASLRDTLMTEGKGRREKRKTKRGRRREKGKKKDEGKRGVP